MRDKRSRAHWATQRSRLDQFVTALNEALHGDRRDTCDRLYVPMRLQRDDNWLFGNRLAGPDCISVLPLDCARRRQDQTGRT